MGIEDAEMGFVVILWYLVEIQGLFYIVELVVNFFEDEVNDEYEVVTKQMDPMKY
jgi:hypothetical protein